MRAGRRRAVRALSVALVAALALAACSSGGGAINDADASGGASDSEAAAQVAEITGLDDAAREKRIQEIGADVEKQMLVLSGLAETVGGESQAVAAYDVVADQLNALALKLRAAPPAFGKLAGAAGRSAGSSSMGAMMFGAMVIGAMAPEAIVGGSNDVEPGAAPAHEVKNDSSGNNSSTMTLDATTETASIDWTAQTSANGLTGKLRVQMKISPCPGPDGSFTATATLTMSSTSSTPGVTKGSNMTVDIKVTGHVDDDARLVGHEVESTTESAEFGSGDNKWTQVTDRSSYTGDKLTAISRTQGRSAGKATPEFARGIGLLGMLIQMSVTPKILEAAKKGWESGRCVALEPTTEPAKRSGLAPSTNVSITAAPRSKIDGSKAGGTVVGALSGASSLDPAGTKVPADATFTYVAPGEVGASASVAFEARSKRGVAKATVSFNTSPDAYDVSGRLASIPAGTTFTGRICDVEKPFTVTTAGDQVGTITFTPTSPTAGKLVFTGRVGNAPLAMKASGTYTIAPPAGAGATGALTLTWRVTIIIPVVGNQTRSGTVPLTLTPRSAC